MKRILTISLIVISFCIYSQNQTSKEWFSNIEIEYGENFEVNYNYALDDDKVDDKEKEKIADEVVNLEKKIADFKIKLNIGEKTDYKSQTKRRN